MNHLFILVIISLLHATIATEMVLVREDKYNELRASQVYEPIDFDKLPETSSAADCFQLCESLIRSEKQFWQDHREEMCQLEPKLPILLKLLAIKKDDTKPLNPIEAFEALNRRMQILAKEEYKNMYDIYKSYSTIIDDLSTILELFLSSTAKLSEVVTSQSIIKIQEILTEKSKEIEQTNLLMRGVFKNNTVGKTIRQLQLSEKGKFGAELDGNCAKYVFCDVEYVTQVFLQTISQILSQAISKLKAEELQLKPAITKQLDRSKKQNNRQLRKTKNTGKKSKQLDVLHTCKSLERTQVLSPIVTPTPDLIQTDITEKKKQIEVVSSQPKLIQNCRAGEMADLESKVQIDNVKEAVVVQTAGVEAGVKISFLVDQDVALKEDLTLYKSNIDVTTETEEQETYPLQPWTMYSKGNNSNHVTEKRLIEQQSSVNVSMPIFKLNEEHSETAKILLMLANSSQDKLEMVAYTKLITEGLKGAVIGQKKGIHFMARSLVNQQWCSVSMHVLHKDDPTIIPRKTRYWKIAKQLLLDIGLTERNL